MTALKELKLIYPTQTPFWNIGNKIVWDCWSYVLFFSSLTIVMLICLFVGNICVCAGLHICPATSA